MQGHGDGFRVQAVDVQEELLGAGKVRVEEELVSGAATADVAGPIGEVDVQEELLGAGKVRVEEELVSGAATADVAGPIGEMFNAMPNTDVWRPNHRPSCPGAKGGQGRAPMLPFSIDGFRVIGHRQVTKDRRPCPRERGSSPGLPFTLPPFRAAQNPTSNT
ncbi:hypothetical protein E2562_000307 [Oryza meyeriana var. granulata]|uniref:Uncharacterized protein n=1 Tax=Oryza meyeriana var. granulata TaxID=110450 RepID=A0A6G1CMR1_9ORYZ|nr:hypothetical protein E2562_000307 [Oryza meyeriana var. granulata]